VARGVGLSQLGEGFAAATSPTSDANTPHQPGMFIPSYYLSLACYTNL